MQPKKSLFPPLVFVVTIVMLSCFVSLHAQTDSLQGKSYEELTQLYESALFRNANDAKVYALEANYIANKQNDEEKIAWSIYHVAYANSFIAEFDLALSGIEESLQIAEKLKNNVLLFKNHNLKGNILSETENDFSALDEYELAKKYADLTKNPLNTIVVDVNVAYLKKIHNDHNEAISMFKESLAFLETINTSDPKKETYKKQILSNLADCYLRIKKPKEAKVFNDLALKISSEKEATLFYHLLLINDAIINYQQKNYDKAIEISKKAAHYYLSIDSKDQLITPYFYLGKSYFELKKYPETIKYLEDAIQIAADNNIGFSDQKDAHELLHLSYTEIGNSAKAKENLNKYKTIDRINDSIAMELNNEIHEKYDIIPMQKEIDSLGKYTNYLYGASILLLLSLIGFFIWYKRKQLQNKTRFQELLLTIEKLEQPKEKVIPEVIVKENTNPVTDENVVQILKALETFEEKELYLRQDCTLGYVAKKVKTNTSYLSNVINTYKEKSFKSYLSELRINAALVKLKNDDKLRSYTIKAIAEEFGFKRSETFSRAFKAQTGMYPSYYIKSLENQTNT
ncbi:helix-turn-helix domain-containing protein [Kordia jejudonensis]|uniref:helix-turn-helix domain-containing protein n=1 Tax=Kordia jejudonensis TaxID=1348245 RepID=UPI0006296D9D|nr:helix-turn-helix domain-containing protein [Kordia jejudonensis]